MFDHVEIQGGRFDSCQHFYATVLAPLLIELKWFMRRRPVLA